MSEFRDEVESKIKMSFNVSYRMTPENKDIVSRFKQFCLINTDDNYLMGIAWLLQNMEMGGRHESLQRQIDELSIKVSDLKKSQMDALPRELNKTFGARER